MDDLTKKKIKNAKQVLANGNCLGVECRFCFASSDGTAINCKATNMGFPPIYGLSDAGIDFFKSKISEYEGGKMKYKVGDMVKVKEGLKAGSVCGRVAFFTDDMVPYCGKIMKISKVHKDYYILENNNQGWTEDMLEPAVFKPHYDKKTVYVNGMHFEMMVDHAVSTKKHETRKEIRKRLLKL